jgi:hypothetical protein
MTTPTRAKSPKGLKDFWAFLKEGRSAQDWLAKATLATFLLDWIVAFGPPQPAKTLVSFLTAVAELITAIVVYEFFQKSTIKTYKILLAVGIVFLVVVIGGYVALLLDRVIMVPEQYRVGPASSVRVVKGTTYEPFADQYRAGYRAENGRFPSDREMLEAYLDLPAPEGGEGMPPQAAAERLWTRSSIAWSTGLLLLLWVGMFSALTFCVLIFLMRQRRGK